VNSFRTIAKNSLVLFAARVLAPVLSFVLLVAVARTLNVVGVGHYRVAIIMALVFQAAASAGLATLLTREGSKNAHQLGPYFSTGSATVVAFSAVLGAAMALMGRALGYPRELVSLIDILAVSLVPAGVVAVSESLFIAAQRAEYVALVSALENTVKLAASLAALKLGAGLPGVGAVIVATRVGAMLAHITLIMRALGVRPSLPDSRLAVSFLGPLLPFTGMQLLVTLYFQLDVVLLSKLASAREVGLYAAASGIYQFLLVLPSSCLAAIFPVLSRLAANGEGLASTCRQANRYLLLLLVPVCGVVGINSAFFVRLLFGAAFQQATPALAIIVWAGIVFASNGVLGYALQSADQEKAAFWVVVLGVALSAALNLALIPVMGARGAAAAAVLSATGGLVANWAFVRRRLFEPRLLSSSWPVLVSGAAAVACGAATLRFGTATSAAAGLAAYAVCIVLLKALPSPSDWMALPAQLAVARAQQGAEP
jgi:O-antigen/teichoic acid export membrane protein